MKANDLEEYWFGLFGSTFCIRPTKKNHDGLRFIEWYARWWNDEPTLSIYW